MCERECDEYAGIEYIIERERVCVREYDIYAETEYII